MTFGDLSPEGKIRAALAAAREPISREQALAFAGVGADLLSDEERAAVEKVFASTVKEKQEGKELHKIDESDDLYGELGIESNEAHRVISQFYLKQMREGSFSPGSKV